MGWRDAPLVSKNAWEAAPVVGDPLGNVQPTIKAPTPAPQTVGDKVYGAGEALVSLLTAVPASVAGPIMGLFHSVTNGKYGTPQGVAEGAEAAASVSQDMTYTPKTPAGKDILESIAGAIDSSKIAGLNPAMATPAMLPGAASFAAQEAKSAASNVASKVAEKVKSIVPETPSMSGVGAAETEAAAIRRARAADLPVPIDLTKGQAERTFEQTKFEREMSKNADLGTPLRQRYAEQNNKVLQNFDAWIDQTGAEAPTLRASGAIVNQALIDKANAAKARIQAAYKAANDAGEMATPVKTDAIVSYLNENRPAAINAPALTTAEQKLVQLGGAKVVDGNLVPGTIPINSLEELRKLVGDVSGTDATNMRFGGQLKAAIDSATESAGGDLYNRARMLRRQYANEFENKGVINKLMSEKPGTTDRAVALEDVFQHSMLNSSLDDVRTVRKTLQTAGPQGEQAWKELQGQTVNYLKNVATKDAARDTMGNPIVNAGSLDKAIKSLDADGKLDFIFGKKGAAQIRDLNDLAKDVYTSPPGAINTSNTSSAIIDALTNMPVLKSLNILKKGYETRKTRAQIEEALKTPQPDLTPQQKLRKDLGYE